MCFMPGYFVEFENTTLDETSIEVKHKNENDFRSLWKKGLNEELSFVTCDWDAPACMI